MGTGEGISTIGKAGSRAVCQPRKQLGYRLPAAPRFAVRLRVDLARVLVGFAALGLAAFFVVFRLVFERAAAAVWLLGAFFFALGAFFFALACWARPGLVRLADRASGFAAASSGGAGVDSGSAGPGPGSSGNRGGVSAPVAGSGSVPVSGDADDASACVSAVGGSSSGPASASAEARRSRKRISVGDDLRRTGGGTGFGAASQLATS